jgi:hypothetical protein
MQVIGLDWFGFNSLFFYQKLALLRSWVQIPPIVHFLLRGNYDIKLGSFWVIVGQMFRQCVWRAYSNMIWHLQLEENYVSNPDLMDEANFCSFRFTAQRGAWTHK